MKKGVYATYTHWSLQHIHRYTAGFQTRGNLRDFDTIDQITMTIRAMAFKRLPYDVLIGRVPSTDEQRVAHPVVGANGDAAA